ncbi:MAG: TolC family protein [Marinilabiliaceae bacterium]|nr:TolC family protein [Marinilabiliaceae bacterium]
MFAYIIKYISTICLTLALNQISSAANASDTIRLTLQEAIIRAHQNSPTAQSARHQFLAAYWNYRYFKANYLPSVRMTTSPVLNRQINSITQGDGTSLFVKQNQLTTDVSLSVSQNISLTGGTIFLETSLARMDELEQKRKSYRAQPLQIGFQQNLFGYNSLKWDKKIEPLQFQQAKKSYAEALELVAAQTCNVFFSWITAKSNLEMAHVNYASADTLYRMALGRYEIGSINESDMLQLDINRLNEETQCMDAEVSLQECSQSLYYLLGIPEDANIILIMPEEIPSFEVPLDKALVLAMENSPEPDMYTLNMIQSESNLAYAKANAGLRADLYAQFGLSQTGNHLKESYKNLSQQEYVSLSVTIPLLDWGRGRGAVRVARSRRDNVETEAKRGIQVFRQNVQKLVMQYNMQSHKVDVASRTMSQANQRYNVAKHLYILGRNTILDLNSATTEKDSARRNYIYSLQTYWSLYYTLRSMTGYDFWLNMPLSELLPIE